MGIFKGTTFPIVVGLISLCVIYFRSELSSQLFPVEANSLLYPKVSQAEEKLTALTNKLENLTAEQSINPETGLMSEQKILILSQVRSAREKYQDLLYDSVKNSLGESRQNTKKLASLAKFFFISSFSIALMILLHNLYKEVWPKIQEAAKRKAKLTKYGSSEDQIKKYRLMLDNGVITKKEFSLKMSMIRQQEGFTPIAQKTESNNRTDK